MNIYVYEKGHVFKESALRKYLMLHGHGFVSRTNPNSIHILVFICIGAWNEIIVVFLRIIRNTCGSAGKVQNSSKNVNNAVHISNHYSLKA
jgi:hypothetical protein